VRYAGVGTATANRADVSQQATISGEEIIMRISRSVILMASLLLPLIAFAEDWSKEQQEVLASEEACINAETANERKACYHEDYVGWSMGSPVALSKSDILKLIDDDYATTENETLLFKPVSVIVKGNMAVVSYVEAGTSTDKRTNEVEFLVSRWTDVLIKDGGKWQWISDHGEDISGD
jgi:hypothetical protein